MNDVAFFMSSANMWVAMGDECKTPSPDNRRAFTAASSRVPPSKVQFSTVTGEDFGRSIAWSKQQRNVVSEQIKTAISSSSKTVK